MEPAGCFTAPAFATFTALLTGWALQHGTVLDQLTVDRPSLEDIYLRLTDHDGPEHTTERNTR